MQKLIKVKNCLFFIFFELKIKIALTTNWYSKTGNSSPLEGPNCFLTPVYLIAIGTAIEVKAAHILTIVSLPTDKLPKEAPTNTIYYNNQTFK